MIIIEYILFSIIVAYLILVVKIMFAVSRKSKLTVESYQGKISVLVPFRNEALNLNSCVKSILNQGYNGQFEVILINDHSENNFSQEIPKDNRIKVIHLSENEQGKKQALTKGTSNSTGSIIVTTDADCIVLNNWLENISKNFIDDEVQISLGEVYVKENNSLVSIFQSSESLILGLFTKYGAKSNSPLLATGANLAFRKSAFQEVNGFSGNDQISSGDDMFLLAKIKQHFTSRGITYHDSIVSTNSVKTWNEFLNQRTRWFKKMKYIKGLNTNYLTTFISIVNTFCLFLLIFSKWHSLVVFSFILIKYIFDLLLLSKSKEVRIIHVLFSPLFFIWNLIYPIVVLFSLLFLQSEWKGRKIN